MSDSIGKPFAPACERNRDPILAVLRGFLADSRQLLEIGSGTGQHAVHFAAALPQLQWQCSDREQNLAGIRAWLDAAALPNTPAPLRLDVGNDDWPTRGFDAAFSANTLHIMAWESVVAMFAGLDRALLPEARLAIYGPFRRGGVHTAESNARFDEQLRADAAHQGVRDLEAVAALATGIGMDTPAIVPMPANNLLLLWQRRGWRA